MSPSPTSRSASFWKSLSCLLALPLCALAEENAADLSKVKPAGDKTWDEKAMLETAETRIQQYRTGLAEIRVLDRNGQPLKHTAVRVRLVSHEFKLGCNAFGLGNVTRTALAPALQRAYEERFAALLNYATLPLYWGMYEAEKGQTKASEVKEMAAWCRAHDIAVKGHPLAWHEVFPTWAKVLPDAEVLQLQKERIAEIVRTFRGSIDIFDAINEATVSANFDNAIGRWVKSRGAANVVDEVLNIAHQANPQATLLYNDFNVSTDYENLVADLQRMKAPVDVLGIQSHMHKELWPMEKVWTVCETYARFGLPLHFTELTILSGKFKDKDDNDWHTVRKDWNSTPEGEQRQLEYGRKLYTLLFSHPAVEAITWWDFSDLQSWAGAPAGLLRKDMSPKPLYAWLMDAFHRKWSTDVVVQTDEAGLAKVQAFYGEYEITAKNGSGPDLKTRLSFLKKGPRNISVSLQ
ncbi:MAG TPA: endo-1,4-beta-xylanase [Candidatus Limnocylindria bacterium]|jgi:GH35 family endo-1,4-beta-xylanase|nr:endo-1,4-beta-xylanase [Candidatus Limnocylindria bacterium]HTL67634.1 endo-1,4-beta-xylanase [Lacunisphaera sp.]